jgi:hypothetical protein
VVERGAPIARKIQKPPADLSRSVAVPKLGNPATFGTFHFLPDAARDAILR